ncbi:MAG: type 2 isopentenyl-diphosphate Delta-isomerase [Legionellales bacterium]|nr:type 2 isopentenyl-diphosphate Delta-isomerase [Legionellales bacterium]
MNNNSCKEPLIDFTKRKVEHIQMALKDKNQTAHLAGLNSISLIHEALPDINFSDISIDTNSLNLKLPSPFLVSSMTAGHEAGKKINHALAKACEQTGWLMGVGSQRRQLYDSSARDEWIEIKKKFPKVKLIGNIGIAQLITSKDNEIENILEPIQAEAIFVHTNPLQECIQPNGDTNYRGSLLALTRICNKLKIPVILKETGCGFSKQTLLRLNDIGLYAVDLSGLGGTHWGRIEGDRAKNYPQFEAMKKFFTKQNRFFIKTSFFHEVNLSKL